MFLNLRIAMRSLSAHKLRAILAMLGVFLGALAFTGVQQVSQVMVRKAQIEAEKLGPNMFVAISGKVRFRRRADSDITGARNFTVADADALAAGLPSVLLSTPFVAASMIIRGGSNAVTCQIMAARPDYAEIRMHFAEYGRYITDADLASRAKVVVLGKAIAERLFGSAEAALGQVAFFYRAGFRVVGVLEGKGRDVTGTDLDEVVIMPLTTYLRRASNQTWVSGAMFRMAQDADMEAVKEAATAILRRRHNLGPGEEDDFSLLTSADAIELQRQALDLMQTLGIITSSVSFAVGGMGILSIMVLIVRARRVEIGVRRAVGGRRLDIVRQFLFEAGLMSVLGGVFGVAMSVLVVAALTVFGGMPFVVDPPLLAMVLAGSALLGVAAGAYPAWQAARIQILDVLRS